MNADCKITFKLASLRDAAALEGLVKNYYTFDHIAFNTRAIRQGLKQLLRNQDFGRAWFIRLGKQTAGYVVVTLGFDYEFGGRLATITDLYLEPDFRGRGIGREALAHIEQFCRKSGIPGLELQVERGNKRAARLYRQFGFEALDRIPMAKQIKK